VKHQTTQTVLGV